MTVGIAAAGVGVTTAIVGSWTGAMVTGAVAGGVCVAGGATAGAAALTASAYKETADQL